jgi:hypothetical protein
MSPAPGRAQHPGMEVSFHWDDTLDRLPLSSGGSLAVARLDWACADARLRLRILAAEPLPVPAVEASEPAAAALARVARSLAGSGALLLLADPAATFAGERIAHAAGCRLMAIPDESATASWDGLLASGQPCYGLHARVVCSVLRPDPASVLCALGFGSFRCEDGLAATALAEDRQGVDLELERESVISVVVRGGFVASSVRARSLRWRDHGHEGVVRIEARADDGGRCWTQPRLVAPAAVAHG